MKAHIKHELELMQPDLDSHPDRLDMSLNAIWEDAFEKGWIAAENHINQEKR